MSYAQNPRTDKRNTYHTRAPTEKGGTLLATSQPVNNPNCSLRPRLDVNSEARWHSLKKVSNRENAVGICRRYLKTEFSYFTSCLISLPFASTAFEMFIVARNDVIKIQVDDCARCLPGQIWRGSAMLPRDSNEEEVMKTYSATEPKTVVFRITAFCHLAIDGF